MASIGIISLGCPKNTIDTEEILGALQSVEHKIETNTAEADVIIVNTCGFIQSAKEEAIDAILNAVRYKTNGACRSVIVCGCLSQRYGEELAREFPEVDAFLGVGASIDIAHTVSAVLSGERVLSVRDPFPWWIESRSRVLSTPSWTAYLRVADGCDNRCTYCAIPEIRGDFRSRPAKQIIQEASALASLGIKELNLVAQDITRYGQEFDSEEDLPLLLNQLSDIDGIQWIRLLYAYPTRVSDVLIETIAENEKVCNYIDIPLQHCSEKILREMGRYGNKEEYMTLFEKIRSRISDVALRTTFIVGFPGETEEDFKELIEFAGLVKFDRMGVFRYSKEDGTPAASLKGRIPNRISERRLDKLMSLQQEISLEKNRSFIGKRIQVLVEDCENGKAAGRSYRDAPDIDGLVKIEGDDLHPGEFIFVEVIDADEYDLYGIPLTT